MVVSMVPLTVAVKAVRLVVVRAAKKAACSVVHLVVPTAVGLVVWMVAT